MAGVGIKAAPPEPSRFSQVMRLTSREELGENDPENNLTPRINRDKRRTCSMFPTLNPDRTMEDRRMVQRTDWRTDAPKYGPRVGLKDGRTEGWTDRRSDGPNSGPTVGLEDERKGRRIEGRIGSTNGPTGGWLEDPTDGRRLVEGRGGGRGGRGGSDAQKSFLGQQKALKSEVLTSEGNRRLWITQIRYGFLAGFMCI